MKFEDLLAGRDLLSLSDAEIQDLIEKLKPEDLDKIIRKAQSSTRKPRKKNTKKITEFYKLIQKKGQHQDEDA